MKNCVLALAVTVLCQGCTTVALERHALRQFESSSDLRYREVLENLASMAANPATLPSYSSIFAGTIDVSDSIQVSSQTVLGHTPSTEFLDVPASRAVKGNWTLDPIVVPEKLRAVRCACWWVLFGTEYLGGDCLMLEKYAEGYPAGYYFDVACKLRSIPPGWLHTGKSHDVPRHASYHASCHGTHVWVMPEGMEGLSAFTVVVQEIARADINSAYFPRPITRTVKLTCAGVGGCGLGDNIKSVTVYLDPEGNPTPGPGLRAVPQKIRVDNVGIFAGLRSQISASK
jgi:hypothetical protein